ncbi:leucine-rich repeat receptor protein kinase HPCA1 [Lactuca sativa]|uniref:non-specific serine/threonine protein kinase n=1 Tax=Lactuca sativa TaxID=4236 RepID=A0A9R1XPN0_LACSA|nr:leucine-rich repeat receptor protein kinase HPCA1 [Lactuca sativa]KAJ0221061.1 hypothetical protein LSAT_V11C200066040 [Lactuca sativa]
MSSSEVDLEKCRIPLAEIIRATKNFSSETLVGDGGFGMVYRGQLSNHWKKQLVAIKRLDPKGYQGTKEFHNEVKLVSSFNHPNIIPFVGYCDDENEKIIVFKYATNRSLEYHLQDRDRRSRLTWEQRLKICLGAAYGLKYLHSGVGEHSRVIHRDLKSANILLDDNLEAKICDFGLSRLSPRNQQDTHVRTKAAGTRFYMDPSYVESSTLTKESDIYSFGVIMFEISSGMMAYHARRFKDSKELYLIYLVRSYYHDHKLADGLDKLIDPTIKDLIHMRSFDKFNEIAHECINFDFRKRPTVDRIIKTIDEALNIQLNGFDSAAYSEAFWNELLPPDYQEIIERAVSPLGFASKKELYFCLSDSHILLDRGYLSFQLDMESGKKSYMLGAKELLIDWQDEPQYWEWGHTLKSRFSEVCILKSVCWLSIHGKIAFVMLSPYTTYVAYLVFRTTSNSKGLSVPAKTMVRFGGIKMETENVYLQRPEGSEKWQENDVFPHRRKDGWMEIKLGEFEYNDEDVGEIEMAFEEVKCLNWKHGLIVEGIELRPKTTDQYSPSVKHTYTHKQRERKMISKSTSLSVLPKGCVSSVLSLTSARKVLRKCTTTIKIRN